MNEPYLAQSAEAQGSWDDTIATSSQMDTAGIQRQNPARVLIREIEDGNRPEGSPG
jgi:hypothetical protein